MLPVPRLGLARLARLAGVTVLLASIATATAEDTELTTAATDQHTVSTDQSCKRSIGFHNHGEGHYYGLLLVESAYFHN